VGEEVAGMGVAALQQHRHVVSDGSGLTHVQTPQLALARGEDTSNAHGVRMHAGQGLHNGSLCSYM
jgi:hypothetical protein